MIGAILAIPYALWFEFLKLNDDYRQYCEAIRNGDAATVNALQNSYPRIADLYEDWEDIFIDENQEEVKFANWFSQHSELFPPLMSAPFSVLGQSNLDTGLFALEEDDIPPYVKLRDLDNIPRDSTVICIPNSYPTKDAVAKTEEVLKKLDARGKRMNARYALKDPGPWRKETYLANWKRLVVARHDRLESGNGENRKLTNIEIARSMVREFGDLSSMVHFEGFGFLHLLGKELPFKLDEYELQYLLEEMSSIEASDFTRPIKRWRSEANSIIGNTIHGVFPVISDQ